MEHGMGWGGMWFGWIFWLIVLVLVIWGAAAFIRSSSGRQNRSLSGTAPGETPLDILKRRYAKGEISREEFEEMKKDLD